MVAYTTMVSCVYICEVPSVQTIWYISLPQKLLSPQSDFLISESRHICIVILFSCLRRALASQATMYPSAWPILALCVQSSSLSMRCVVIRLDSDISRSEVKTQSQRLRRPTGSKYNRFRREASLSVRRPSLGSRPRPSSIPAPPPPLLRPSCPFPTPSSLPCASPPPPKSSTHARLRARALYLAREMTTPG